jgi:hypothetical protein
MRCFVRSNRSRHQGLAEPEGRTLPPCPEVRTVSGVYRGQRCAARAGSALPWARTPPQHISVPPSVLCRRQPRPTATLTWLPEISRSDFRTPATGWAMSSSKRQSAPLAVRVHDTCSPGLLAADHLSAVLVIQKLAGQGVSAQATLLRAKIFEIDAWIQDCAYTAIEVNPELCFAPMAGGPVPTWAKTWAGAEQRRHSLTPPVADCPANSAWRARWPRWTTSWTRSRQRGPHVSCLRSGQVHPTGPTGLQ